MKKLFFLFFISIIAISYSQNEANIWYFGQNAGLDFSNGDPVALSDGQLSTVEGCSTFSDQNGNLLFYSDGITVYNKNHQVMQNGNNLGGNPSSSQSGLIVPSPGNPDIFYLFTVGTNAIGNTGFPTNAGFKYYTIDMTANGGLGKVNNGFVDLSGTLSDLWTEKVTAVQGDGCNSIWVISLVGNTFYSFLVDSNGVSTTPIISTIANTTDDVRGYLKISPDATKIVAANMTVETYLYDFDNVTGIVSNGNSLNLNGNYGYGIEFALNSKVLYISTGNFEVNSTEILYQFNLDLADFNAINLSRKLIKTYTNTRGALQLAPNGKIYWASDNSSLISVINDPENLGNLCNYSHLTVDLGGRLSTQGLPPFIQSLFLPNVDIINDGSGILIDQLNICEGNTYTLEPDISTFPPSTTYVWSVNGSDIIPAVTTSTLTVDGITYGTGNYKILIDFNDGVTCPFYGEAQIDYHPNPIIISPITIKQCDDDTDGFAFIDLTLTNESISVNSANETFSYYHSQADAESNNAPIDTTNFHTDSTGANPIWVRVENDYCHTVGQVDITISTSNTNFNRAIYKCDDFVDAANDDYDGIATFDLTQFEGDLLQEFPVAQQPNLNFNYYPNLNDAQLQTNAIVNPSSYRNLNTDTAAIPEQIFIRVNNNSNIDCAGMGTNLYINLIVEKLPIAHPANTLRACETTSNSAEGEFDTTNIPNLVLQGQTDVTLTYFEEDGTQIPTTTFINPAYLANSKTVSIRATNNHTNTTNNEACYDETTVELIVDDLPFANPVPKQTLCDDLPNQNDNLSVFDTSNIAFLILGEALASNMEIHYYYPDGSEILPTLPEFFTSGDQTIQVEVINIDNPTCIATTSIEFEIVSDNPEFEVPDQLLCTNLLPENPLQVTIENPLEIDYFYIWEDAFGNSIPTDTNDPINSTRTAIISKGGEYSVTATSTSMCTTTKTFMVLESSIPKIDTITIFDNLPNNRVSVVVSGDGDYEFALDNNPFVDSNELNGHIFYHVKEGLHVIKINDKNGCTPIIEREIVVIRFPKYISPNEDGVNDTFYILGGDDLFVLTTTIFDRYGKVITVLNQNEKWHGTYLGKVANPNDYWFIAKFTDRQGEIHERKGNFSLVVTK